MAPGVVAETIPRIKYPALNRVAARHLHSDLEERGMRTVAREHAKDGSRLRPGAIVERERNRIRAAPDSTQ
jgi:hypothetical protein